MTHDAHPRTPAPAPAPDELMVYDGDCAVCTSIARWARHRLGDRARVEPWQVLDLDALGLTEADVTTAMYWIDRDGTTHRGHLGVARLLKAFGGAWRVPGRLCRTAPTSWLAAVLYRLVAANRHRLPGATPTCRLDEGP